MCIRDSLRDSVWANLLSDDFIAEAFQLTHELDPEAFLIYNDYHLHLPWRRDRMVRLVEKIRSEGAPIDAVGIQGHYNIDEVPMQELEELLILLREMDLQIVISELDIDVVNRNAWWADGGAQREELAKHDPYKDGCPPEILQRQAEQYADLFRLFKKYHDVIHRVSFWNVHDGDSWLNYFPWDRVNHPLLFDRERQPKPAYNAVMRVLGNDK